MPTAATKKCSRCGEPKAEYRTNGYCRSCNAAYVRERYWADPESARARTRENNRKRREDPISGDRIRRVRNALRYGLSLEQYDELMARADGKCEICGEPHDDGKRNGRGMIDHCHDTGMVRGVLCRTCNSAIAFLNHDPELLHAAAAYLRKYEEASL